MKWIKEEITDRKELKDTVGYVFNEMGRLPSIDINEVVDNILKALPQQVEHPLISYTWYLIFEALFFKHIIYYMLYEGGDQVPLWIYKYGSENIKKYLREKDCREYYRRILRSSPVLDEEGEFGELILFIQDYDPELIWESEQDMYEDMKRALFNPDWRSELSKMSKEEQQKWNRKYEPEDWMTHSVL